MGNHQHFICHCLNSPRQSSVLPATFLNGSVRSSYICFLDSSGRREASCSSLALSSLLLSGASPQSFAHSLRFLSTLGFVLVWYLVALESKTCRGPQVLRTKRASCLPSFKTHIHMHTQKRTKELSYASKSGLISKTRYIIMDMSSFL